MESIDPKLRTALDSLRGSARSLHDIREWVLSHLEILTGNMLLPQIYCINLKLSCHDAAVWNDVVNTGALAVHAPLTLTARFHPNPILIPEDPAEKLSYICCNHDFNLTLGLQDWPFACAYVTGLLFSTAMPALTEQNKTQFLDKVDSSLTTHFPGFTRKRLEDLIAGEIIPVDSRGRPSKHDVMNLLFASKETVRTVLPPLELV